MLILGNPPVSEENTWFERLCSSPRYNVIRVGAFDTPAWTGEQTGQCRTCPPGVPPHEVVTHLVDEDWVQGVVEEFGEDSAYYQARVMAQFPRDNSSKVLPMSWLELAQANILEDQMGEKIRLGVDVAADGGDEFVIARADGWKVGIVHAKAGSDNEDPVRVAGRVAEEIDRAELDHKKRGITDRVVVKVDAIGVGWGVTGFLSTWQREGRFRAEIIGVNVSKTARDAVHFSNQRGEMWWNARRLIQPIDGEPGVMQLDITTRELAQLNGPTYGTDSSGRITIEKKADMKKRGVGSPDRAEAILLAVFEPPTARTVAPVGLNQANVWASLGGSR
jgi:hypothetical protein